jgi:hypothetical protein
LHTSPCRQPRQFLIDLLATSKGGITKPMRRLIKEP